MTPTANFFRTWQQSVTVQIHVGWIQLSLSIMLWYLVMPYILIFNDRTYLLAVVTNYRIKNFPSPNPMWHIQIFNETVLHRMMVTFLPFFINMIPMTFLIFYEKKFYFFRRGYGFHIFSHMKNWSPLGTVWSILINCWYLFLIFCRIITHVFWYNFVFKVPLISFAFACVVQSVKKHGGDKLEIDEIINNELIFAYYPYKCVCVMVCLVFFYIL